MATRDINKLAKLSPQYIYMLEDTTGFCLDPQNIATTQLVPDFETDMKAVDAKVKIILSNLGPRMIMTKGFGDQKEYYRSLLAQAIFAVTNPVSGWAMANKKFDLAKQMSDALSAYMKRKPNELASFATTVVDVVRPMLPTIVKTGVTITSLDAINAARAAFVPFINKPSTAKDDIKTNTKMLRQLLSDALNIVYFQADRYAVQFKQMGKMDYFNSYMNRRKLKNYGTKHAFASVDVFMGDSNSTVKNALITVEGSSAKAKNFKNGHYTVSPVSPGMRSITVTVPGFPSPVITDQQEFIKGKPCYFTVMMNEFTVPAAKSTKEKVNS